MTGAKRITDQYKSNMKIERDLNILLIYMLIMIIECCNNDKILINKKS